MTYLFTIYTYELSANVQTFSLGLETLYFFFKMVPTCGLGSYDCMDVVKFQNRTCAQTRGRGHVHIRCGISFCQDF